MDLFELYQNQDKMKKSELFMKFKKLFISYFEYDEDFMGGAMGFIDELEASVKQLYERIENGTYKPGDGELSFMEIVRNADKQLLPFKHLFLRIEETHEHGFE